MRNLRAHGHHFRQQAPFRGYVLDFVSYGDRLVIEVDGAKHGSPESIARDAIRDDVLAREGFRTKRFLAAEVMDNLEGVASVISGMLGIDPASACPHPVTTDNPFTWRLATSDDLPALRILMADSIGTLQRGFLTEMQIEASRGVMGLDTQLVADGSYFIVEASGVPAGCGGWSRRATLYGGDHTPGRDAMLLDPARDAARIRAMYTAPVFARQGVGRLVLRLCEAAAAADGFTRVELAATLAGQPLYEASGYTVLEILADSPVPLLRMGKTLPATAA